MARVQHILMNINTHILLLTYIHMLLVRSRFIQCDVKGDFDLCGHHFVLKCINKEYSKNCIIQPKLQSYLLRVAMVAPSVIQIVNIFLRFNRLLCTKIFIYSRSKFKFCFIFYKVSATM